MVSITNYAFLAYGSNAKPASAGAEAYARKAPDSGSLGASLEKSAGLVEDTVTLSDAAIEAIRSGAVSPKGYGKYMPSRDGFGTSTLSNAVSSPGRETISAGKTVADVATAARASMDVKYAAMNSAAAPFDANSAEDKDTYSLMGDLDRRALYAVRSNEGGQFSKDEQAMAQTVMAQQQGLAMGLYSGPTRMADEFNATDGRLLAQEYTDMDRSAVEFLDNVGPEEKSSVEWAVSRASAQVSYEWMTKRDGTVPDNLDSTQPLANLVATAMRTMKQGGNRGSSSGRIDNVDTLKAQSWFKGFERQLDRLMSLT